MNFKSFVSFMKGGLTRLSKTNCINCGAAKDTSEIKCPFCGTTYLDLTAIDFDSGNPVVCQFVLPNQSRRGDYDGRFIMSMLATPVLEEITTQANTVDVSGALGTHIASFVTSYDINIGVSFKPVCRQNESKQLITLEYQKEE